MNGRWALKAALNSASKPASTLVQRQHVWLRCWMLVCCLWAAALPAHSASKTLLLLGDSLSAEYGLPRGTGWASLLAQQLRDDKLDAALVNASISGETTAGGKARLPALLAQHKPDILILELGGNDGLRGLSLAATRDNLQQMITMAANAGARTLLVGMQVPPNYGPDYSKRFAAMYEGLAKDDGKNKAKDKLHGKGVKLVPFLLSGLDDTERWFQPDRIHPNREAQPVMLRNVWPVLKPMLKAER